MKVLDPGHKYELDRLDGFGKEILTFVKREGALYPGNVGHYEGTNLQEVIRALIDRIKYLDGQIHDDMNSIAVSALRNALFCLESRAAARHGRKLSFLDPIELAAVCELCGHIGCSGIGCIGARTKAIAGDS
jgi:hypothetical protein